MLNPLPYLLSIFTGPRYLVKAGVNFEWSDKSWTHNVFRVYELIFGRKAGIRAELSSYPYSGGTLYICHSWESVFALTETKIREFLTGLVPKFEIVSVPQFATANGINVFSNSPYLFAIAFDAVSSADGGIAVTNTYSHTCTGSDLTLTTGAIVVQNPTPTATATYAAAAMTSGANLSGSPSFVNTYIFYKTSPATGANDVVTTASASARNYGGSISMTGTNTSSVLGNTNTANGTSTTPSVSVTTGTANSWIIYAGYLSNTIATLSPSATGTGQTSRYQIDHAAGGVSGVGSTQTTTSAGSYTSSWSVGSSTAWSAVVIEIKPAAATTTNFLTLLGIGT